MKKYVVPFLTVLFFGNSSVSVFGADHSQHKNDDKTAAHSAALMAHKKTVEERVAQERNKGSNFNEAVFRAREHLRINPNLTDQELLELGCTKEGIRIARLTME